jgi:4-carboxymuconolactone decarboxylase
MASLLDLEAGCSLRSVAREMLEIDVDKSLPISDWSLKELSDQQISYAALDSALPLLIARKLWPQLKTRGVECVYRLHRAAIPAVAAMELAGMHFAVDAHSGLLAEWREKQAAAEAELRKHVGPELNLDSSQQLASYLERTLTAEQLASWPRTPGGQQLSTSDDVFSRFASLEVIRPLSTYRESDEGLVNTPADGYIACCEAIRDADLHESIPAIHVPTLVIAGAEDPATTVEEAGFLTQTIAGSKHIQLTAAHLSNVESAEEFSESVSAFLLERDLFSKGIAVRRAVLGDVHVDRSLANLSDFNREFQDLITRYAWGEIWTRPGLPRHTRSLITLATMVALNRTEEFRIHVRAAFNSGVSREQIKEVLLQTAIYCGVPAANAAFHAAEQVFAELEPKTN